MNRFGRLLIACVPLAIGFGWWWWFRAYMLDEHIDQPHDLFFYVWPVMGAVVFTIITAAIVVGICVVARWVWRGSR